MITPTSKPDRRVSRTRASLSTAYRLLLEETPPEKITVAALCRKADINRSTFYQHYEDVDALKEELLSGLLIQLDGIIAEIVASANEAVHAAQAFLDFIRENRQLLKAFAVEDNDLDFRREIRRRGQELFRTKILQSNPTLNEAEPETAECLLAFLTGGFYSIYRHWLLSGCGEDIGEAVGAVGKMVSTWLKSHEFNH